MKPLKIDQNGKTSELHCTHADQWPPAHTKLDESFESQRERGFIDESKYQQLQVWQRVCSKMKMDKGCAGCKLALHQVGSRMVPFVKDKAAPRQPYATRQKGIRREG
jgi:hypothetical protein